MAAVEGPAEDRVAEDLAETVVEGRDNKEAVKDLLHPTEAVGEVEKFSIESSAPRKILKV
jgi:hypothetical protein